ncbi:hypothetical protein UA08_03115 [Talaromyces atroroseus]|uniref:FAD-binding domain-containing protein n=1 Tax=Talaromyces atroroseus TaxID=1441469 RepID=A0A225AZ75_TALAT|nr:hypothetical protein UA08_03115 [Talaromyces atroroseus]OKL61019.1 hypothetical protein UA08_03115 [Talaromyces atroroseus]
MLENILPQQFGLHAQNRPQQRHPIITTAVPLNNIIDIRSQPQKRDQSLRTLVQEKIHEYATTKGVTSLPDLLLWNEKGLKYFEDVTYSPSYYLTNEEIHLLEKNKYKIAANIPSGTMLVELGSGNLRKVKILLDALEELGRDVDYYALDVSHRELLRTLALVPPGHFNHIRCFGLLGTYDDGRDWLQRPEVQGRPKTILSLGSTLGSFQRADVAEFLASFCASSGSGGDHRNPSFLVGLDGCKNARRVLKAYNDEQGINRRFVKNGLHRANQILGYDAFDLSRWKVTGGWDEQNGSHNQYYYPAVDTYLDSRDATGKIVKSSVPAGRKLLAVQSYKYDWDDQAELVRRAGLDVVDCWASEEDYNFGKMNNTSTTDLLIIGAGPAGLMAACWASQFSDMSTRIIDQKPGRTQRGHADGLHSRTLEILDSFGIADRILRQAVGDFEMCYWNHNSETSHIERGKRSLSQPRYLSRLSQVLLNQGLIEGALLNYLNEERRIDVEWQKKGEIIDILPATDDNFNVKVKVRDLSEESNTTEIIRAQYVIACDGAQSSTREQQEVPMESHSEESIWGVLDIVPITNFRTSLYFISTPFMSVSDGLLTKQISADIRQSCVIQSERSGQIMTAPRENRLLRMYIQLNWNGNSQRGKRRESPESLVKIAAEAIQPYHLTFRHCDWWSIYKVKQRLVKRYRVQDRIFLAGDAAHMHSPMAGQGMNISMQDTYNLAWKIGSVITRKAHPSILDTYQEERHPVAQELMELDNLILQAYKQSDPRCEEVEKVREKYAGFITGTRITYPPSILTAQRKNIDSHVTVGMRLDPFDHLVANHASGSSIQIRDLLRSPGALWRLIIFPGDLREEQKMEKLRHFAASSFAENLLPKLRDRSCLEIILVHSSPRLCIDFFDIPDIFRPFDETFGYEYEKIFTDYGSHNSVPCHSQADERNEASEFCILCRPDQHVAWAGGMNEMDDLENFLAPIFV